MAILLSSLFIIFLIPKSQASNDLPDLGSSDLVIYDQTTEQRLGEAFKASLHQNFQLSNDLVINQYIRDLGHELASYTGNSRQFRFYVIEDESINAFAGPNGIIGIHTGLIEATESEAELAAVVAHEISHVTQNHLSRRYEYASSYGNLNSLATLLAAILIGSIDPNAGMATLMGGMGYNLQQQLKNSRLHESEADSIGIQLLHQAGFNPHAMGDFFGRLSKNESLNTFKVPEILRTHPVSDERLAEAENRASQLDNKAPKKDSTEFRLVKIKLAKLKTPSFSVKPNLTAEEKCIQSAFNNHSKNDCLKNIKINNQTSKIYITELLKFYSAEKDNLTEDTKQQLINKISLMIDLYPNNVPLLLSYVDFVIAEQSATEGAKLLAKRINKLDYQYQANRKLSELYAEKNKLGYAYYYLARFNIEIGNIKRAEYYLTQAEDLKNKTDKTLESKINRFRQKHDKLLKNIDKQE